MCRSATRPAKALAAALLALPLLMASSGFAAAETRSLKLYFTHTGERANIVYKRNGRFDQKGLNQINRILRDWRRNEPTKMDPRLLDLVWEVYGRVGARDYIHVVSAYRSPKTNNMLRGRSRTTGVAKKSQHMLGKAMDFFIPGVKISTLRATAMQMQVGGVGYYPTSGSPFVHLDVGSVRAWPRMSQRELANLFPNGRTLHLPTNGRPLPGYQQALADYKRRIGPRSIEIAATAEDDDDAAPVIARGRSRDADDSGLVTAMLPTPKSRAQAALDMQSKFGGSPKEKTEIAEKREEKQVELLAAAIPVPSPRPKPVETTELPPDNIVVASIGPIPAQRPTLPAPVSKPFGDPAIRQDLAKIRVLKDAAPATGTASAEPVAIRSLAHWALLSPGQRVAMKPPVLVKRSLETEPGAATETVEQKPMAAGGAFDFGRFVEDEG
ncbi:DUF882 domain-containing protein [Endobacterium cereale]|nr:DUF882 domain-containing protein [Endobacterium cereale]MEB2844803.1 DUF882 domain-containing protein [Endobacterium cereale]